MKIRREGVVQSAMTRGAHNREAHYTLVARYYGPVAVPRFRDWRVKEQAILCLRSNRFVRPTGGSFEEIVLSIERKKIHRVYFRRSCNSRPLFVNRYFCFLLRGTSGMVISMRPASRAGRKYFLARFARSLRPRP